VSVGEAGLVEEILQGIRIHHYRAKPVDEAVFRDTWLDTADGLLAAHGVFYRFRERVRGEAGSPWSVRLEREEGRDAKGLDLRSALPGEVGREIAGGAWERAILGGEGLEAPERLREILAELDVDAATLAPRLRGELARTRYELTDKGRSWFELDREDWSFRREPDGDELKIVDLVLDTRLRADDPELLRRVRTMDMLLTRMFPVTVEERKPHARAAEALASR
jgi:hypothetical protein